MGTVKYRPSFEEEELLWSRGFDIVCGMDEVGRGAFAGPVVTASVVFDKKKRCSETLTHELNDSKLLTPKTRVRLAEEIKRCALFYAVSVTPVSIINKSGIGKAAYISFRKSAQSVYSTCKSPLYFLIDGFTIPHLPKPHDTNQKAIIKGDQKSFSIAAASVIAKVHRDALMDRYHLQYRAYDFIKNKGYGTAFHRQMLAKHGPSPIHRTSFRLSKFFQAQS